ncbi:MAG: adenine deaminase [Candidatus Parvibacillus calidus]|nr:MAG: adenine deaminase [Candidatus Parvibacillus calidus]
MTFEIESNLVDIPQKSIYPVRLRVENGSIAHIMRIDRQVAGYILPGFVDAHVHIESSLLVPSEFARMAVIHGTVATVSDPHEIANVCGVPGIQYMLDDADGVPFYFNFGAPSCVPATVFETAGDIIGPEEIKALLQNKNIKYLAEMMNFPGVIHRDPDVIEKIRLTREAGKKIDGHAPGLRGEDAMRYFEAGISTDHECYELDEAIGKLKLGVHILIREGSAARNFEALIPAIADFPGQIMFCSDDKHPDSLLLGHINQLVSRAVRKGYDLFNVLNAACINPVLHYGLEHGMVRPGDSADFILVNDLEEFNVIKTYIRGHLVAENGKSFIPSRSKTTINHFNAQPIDVTSLADQQSGEVSVIECLDGQLITNHLRMPSEECTADNDVLKVAVINRYREAQPALGRIRNFGLKSGALACTVAHDSHNIIAVGVDDASMARVINELIKSKGGLAATDGTDMKILPLPVAGLMSDGDAWQVSRDYTEIDDFAKQRCGSTLRAPFMSLSFMALPVIPHLKMTDKGLFDVDTFAFA